MKCICGKNKFFSINEGNKIQKQDLFVWNKILKREANNKLLKKVIDLKTNLGIKCGHDVPRGDVLAKIVSELY